MIGLLKATCLLLVCAASQALAAPVSFQFSVQVNEIHQWDQHGSPPLMLGNAVIPVGGQVALGDLLTVVVSFDADKLALPPDIQVPSARYFWDVTGAAQSLRLTTAEGVTYQAPATPYSHSIQLQQNMIAFNSFDAAITTGLLLADWPSLVFEELELPDNLSLSAFPYTWFGMGWGIGTAEQIDVRGVVTGVTRVPEPASLALLMVGALGLAAVRRKSTV